MFDRSETGLQSCDPEVLTGLSQCIAKVLVELGCVAFVEQRITNWESLRTLPALPLHSTGGRCVGKNRQRILSVSSYFGETLEQCRPTFAT